MSLLHKLKTLLFGLNRGLLFLAGWGILIVMIFTTYSVVMRYVFNSPDVWTHPTSAYILCFIIFAGLACTHQEGGHVRVDYFLQVLPRRISVIFRIIGDLASSAFLVLFTWQLWRVFQESLTRNRVDETTLSWPLAAVQWILPLGAGLLLVTHLVVSVKSALQSANQNDDDCDGEFKQKGEIR